MFTLKLVKLLENKSGIYIQTHNFPDPDAVASAYGLQKFLEHFNIQSTIVYDGNVSKINLVKMIEVLKIEMCHIKDVDMKADDCIVLVDAQKSNSNVTDCKCPVIACIDHHPTFIKVKYAYKDIRLVGSCSSIIANMFRNNSIEISSELATALLYGIKIDTDELMRGVKDLDIDMYCMLYKIADMDILNSLTMNVMTIDDLKAYGAAIQNVVIEGNVGFAEIPFDCPDALTAMISDFILDLDVVSFSVVYCKRNDGLKFSVRSKIPKVLNAGKVIQSSLMGVGSGGGHPSMAGGFIPDGLDIEDVNKFIRQKFIENIHIDEEILKNQEVIKAVNYSA